MTYDRVPLYWAGLVPSQVKSLFWTSFICCLFVVECSVSPHLCVTLTQLYSGTAASLVLYCTVHVCMLHSQVCPMSGTTNILSHTYIVLYDACGSSVCELLYHYCHELILVCDNCVVTNTHECSSVLFKLINSHCVVAKSELLYLSGVPKLTCIH